jgi:DNA-binding LytR/AlgR family response regulator
MKKIFIVEDESEFVENIEIILNFSGHLVVGKEKSGQLALNSILQLDPDLILLDINLKGSLDGINVAHKLREYSDVPIIFITAHSDESYLAEIAGIKNNSFILKPFSMEALNTIISLTFMRQTLVDKNPKILNIRDKGFTVPLKEENIIMLKAEGLYTRIYLAERQYIVRDILKDVTAKLPESKFIRVHKSFIVNLSHVIGFNSKEVAMLNHKVPIRRGYAKKFAELIRHRDLTL